MRQTEVKIPCQIDLIAQCRNLCNMIDRDKSQKTYVQGRYHFVQGIGPITLVNNINKNLVPAPFQRDGTIETGISSVNNLSGFWVVTVKRVSSHILK